MRRPFRYSLLLVAFTLGDPTVAVADTITYTFKDYGAVVQNGYTLSGTIEVYDQALGRNLARSDIFSLDFAVADPSGLILHDYTLADVTYVGLWNVAVTPTALALPTSYSGNRMVAFEVWFNDTLNYVLGDFALDLDYHVVACFTGDLPNYGVDTVYWNYAEFYTYTYLDPFVVAEVLQPVPTPSSFVALIGMCAMGFVGVARRRWKKA